MTAIKTITKIIRTYVNKLHTYMTIMILPCIVYIILDLFSADSFNENFVIEKSLVVLTIYALLWYFISYRIKKQATIDIIKYNELRVEENHEFAKLVIDGKLYTDNRIMDIVEEMGKIMNEESKQNDD